PVAAPSNYYIDFTQVSGAANLYQGTLYELTARNTRGLQIGQTTFTMPPGIDNVALEGGPGDNVIQVDPSVTLNMYLYGGPGHNTLMAGSGNDTLVAGSGTAVLHGGSGNDVLYGSELPALAAAPTLTPVQTWNGQSGNLTKGSKI